LSKEADLLFAGPRTQRFSPPFSSGGLVYHRLHNKTGSSLPVPHFVASRPIGILFVRSIIEHDFIRNFRQSLPMETIRQLQLHRFHAYKMHIAGVDECARGLSLHSKHTQRASSIHIRVLRPNEQSKAFRGDTTGYQLNNYASWRRPIAPT
jgi:hypothetical protein